MARTILEIAKSAAERDLTAPAPTTLFDTNNKVAKILRVAASDTMRDYLRRSGWKGLSEFHSTWVFGLTPGRYAYPLPPDFLRVIPNTEHLAGSPVSFVGPASPQAWAGWIFGIGGVPAQMGWRIRNNAIFFDPHPTSPQLVAIEYVSRFPVVSRIAAGDYDFTVSPAQCTSPFVPRDGFVSLNGAAATAPTSGAGEYDTAPPGWDDAVFGQEVSEALRAISPTSAVAPFPMVRRPEFTADTDIPAFDDDHVLSLGMTFRLRRALGLDYAEVAGEYEEEIESKSEHDAGGARDIRLGRSANDVECYPLSNGSWMVT